MDVLYAAGGSLPSTFSTIHTGLTRRQLLQAVIFRLSRISPATVPLGESLGSSPISNSHDLNELTPCRNQDDTLTTES